MTRRRVWRAANIIMAALFAFAVVVQVNDPDPVRWMVLYGLAAVVCALEARRGVPWPAAAGVALVAVGAAVLVASGAGELPFASMFGAWEMKDAAIEEAREVVGLVFVAGWMAVISLVRATRTVTGQPG